MTVFCPNVQLLMHQARDFVMATGGLERFPDPHPNILAKLGACHARKIGPMNKKSVMF